MRLHSFCFVFAALAVVTGMCLGIFMGISEDHTLAPVHVHLNLIGWVSMAIIGLYYRTSARDITWLERAQAGTLAVGITGFAGGITLLFLGTTDAAERAGFVSALSGALLCLAAMILFLIVVVRDTISDARLARTKQPSLGKLAAKLQNSGAIN